MRNFSIRFPAEQLAIIKAAAELRGFTPTAYVRWAVDCALAEKNPMREIDDLKATSQATYLTLHELQRELYIRIPPPPGGVRELAEQDGKAALRAAIARVAALMAEMNGCKK